jgi:hypothetical protein
MLTAVRLALVVAASAAALWLLPASIHIVNWSSTGPVRVALLAPSSRLAWAVVIAAGGWAVVAALWTRLGRGLDDLARRVSPLWLLWIWAVPYLPWIPDRAPELLVFAGPVRWVIVLVAVGATVMGSLTGNFSRHFVITSRSVIFVVSLLIYAAAGVKFASDAGFGGDEPHYLVITHSLLVDHDLAIENNHARGDYRTFFGGELRPDFLRRGRNDTIYSIHAPGLPALLLPAYAIGGATGAVVMMAIMAALAALAVFDIGRLVAGEQAATVTWAALCLTVPFVPQAWLIYPELPCALIVGWAVIWFMRPADSALGAGIQGLVLGILPWLHTKFAVLVPVLAGFCVYRLWPRMKPIAAMTVALSISVAAWLLSFYWMYGVFDPQAPYGTSPQTNVLFSNIPRSVLGLLFDQKFGILVYSPVYLLGFIGAAIAFRDRNLRTLGLSLCAAIFAFVVGTTRFYMWWGGSSAPARFLVPIVPLAAPAVALAIGRIRSRIGQGIVTTLVAISVAIAAVSVMSPREELLYSDPHGYSRLLIALQGGAPLDRIWPTFTEEDWRTPARALMLWLGAFGAAAALTLLARRYRLVESSLWTVTLLACCGVLLGALLTDVQSPKARADIANRGKLALLEAVDPPKLRAIGYVHNAALKVDELGSSRGGRTMIPLNGDETLGTATISVERRGDRQDSDRMFLEGPFELPEGRYEVQVWFESMRPEHGSVMVRYGPDVEARSASTADNPAVIPVTLPITGPIWVGASDPGTGRAIERIAIQARTVVPLSARLPFSARGVEKLESAPGAYLAYVDDRTYPEGGVYWTRATEQGTVVVVPGSAATLQLILHVGANGGPVKVRVGAERSTVELNPGETKEIEFPVPQRGRPVPVSVKAQRAFRPADVDPQSADRRLLGCQVRPRLLQN